MAKTRNMRNGVQNHAADWLFEEATGTNEGDADYNQIEPSILASLVWSTVHMGGNIQLGATKDGSTYVLRFFFGTPKKPMYFEGTDEGRAALLEFADKLLKQAIEHG